MDRKDWPSFYDPSKVGTRYEPDINAAITAGMAAGLAPASRSTTKVLSLMIDYQGDFTDFPGQPGTLSVPGTVDDVRRQIEWLFTNVEVLTGLMLSLDQHLPYQIFYPSWWADRTGKGPAPFTLLKDDEVKAGLWRPLYKGDWSRSYVAKLGAFMIWPYHCMIGTPGAALVPALAEAVAFVAAARRIQPTWLFKGSVPETEHYGPFKPCVIVPDNPLGGLNTQMLDVLREYGRIYAAGEAFQYCFATGMEQTVEYYEETNQPDVLKRLVFLNDCTSPVQPYTDVERKALEDKFRDKGIQLVRSTDPVVL